MVDLMRLITGTLLVIGALLLLILIIPSVFLQATASYLPEPFQENAGEMLAGFSIMIGRPVTAVDVYDFLISRHPDSSEYYRQKSEALLLAEDGKRALEALNSALARDSQNVVLLEKKGRLLIRAGKTTDADAVFSTILAIQTDNPDYLSIIADVALEKNKYIEAFDRYTRLLGISPDNGLTWEKRSDVIFALLTIPTAAVGATESFRSKDLYSEGISGYEKAFALNPDRAETINTKIEKRSAEYVPRSIMELEGRYLKYRYLKPDEKPLPD
jgi:tetratricopeptide (TPR) repeat protein